MQPSSPSWPRAPNRTTSLAQRPAPQLAAMGGSRDNGPAKLIAVCNAIVRLVLLPVLLLRELLLIPWRFPADEPGSEAETETAATAAARATRPLPGRLLTALADWLRTPSGIVPLRRFQHSWQRSWLLLWESVVFYGLIGTLELLGWDRLLVAFRPELRRLCCALAGKGSVGSTCRFYEVPYDAAQFPFLAQSTQPAVKRSRKRVVHLTASAAGAAGALFPQNEKASTAQVEVQLTQLPPSQLPGKRAGVRKGDGEAAHRVGGTTLSLQDCHLLCQAALLVYEDEAVVRKVLAGWGLQLQALHEAPAHLSAAAGYVPDVAWLMATTDAAVIVAFRGADPFTQVSRQSDIPTAKSERAGMGQVLDGFYRGMFHESTGPRIAPVPGSLQPAASLGPTVGGCRAWSSGSRSFSQFTILHDRLAGLVSDQRPLYLTGHSLGAAMASVFAMGLHARGSKLAEYVGGIATFGQPRLGDANFAALYNKRLAGKALRFVHGCDMVTELPTAFAGYCHTGGLVQLPPWPQARMLGRCMMAEAEQPGAVAAAVEASERWAVVLAAMAAVAAPVRGEPPAQCIARIALIAMPGIADHLPPLYEAALRDALQAWYQTTPLSISEK
eukprot:CAMPEP_0206150406 /NCGR_PEP_ID=MMETSP1473-20131121/38282_1 /ASSEMBLY_ACC=CAM_ASM_001109 /TAXON_ID=1461547 /ORGANISM="Stichococcus sp, Strain RCC1054" /LENGTH=612 /DNA_ID=CAMNT_0053547905 /DNA_START=321 /DNA_END=2159 /DNA_ORIENTATION=-